MSRLETSSMLVPFLSTNAAVADAVRSRGVTWERTLRHFERLVCCGSPLHLEHAQRISSLFCKYGSTKQLMHWWMLFRAESIPFCTTQLVALSNHGLWSEAQRSLELTAFPWQPKLGEHAIALAMSKRMWVDALHMLDSFPTLHVSDQLSPREMFTRVPNFSGKANSVQKVLDCSYNGVASAIAAIPKQSWLEAVRVCVNVSKVVSSESAIKLHELAVLRLISAKQYSTTRKCLSKLNREWWTPPLARSFLRVALHDGVVDEAIEVMEFILTTFGEQAVTGVLTRKVVELALNEPDKYLERLHHMFVNKGHLLDEAQRLRFTCLCVSNELPPPRIQPAASVKELDEDAMTLLARGQWLEALEIAHLIATRRHCEVDQREKLLIHAVTQAKNWKDALKVFCS